MADRSFGVREINIVGSAGTPTISSPDNINLNGNRVAISTDLQVGRNATVSGIITANAFYGDGTNLTGVTGVGTQRGDDEALNFGDSDDLQIYHNGVSNIITGISSRGTGKVDTFLTVHDLYVNVHSGQYASARFKAGSVGVELYSGTANNNVGYLRFAAAGIGCTVYGDLRVTAGTGGSGGAAFRRNVAIGTDVLEATDALLVKGDANITGVVTANQFVGDGSLLTNLPGGGGGGSIAGIDTVGTSFFNTLHATGTIDIGTSNAGVAVTHMTIDSADVSGTIRNRIQSGAGNTNAVLDIQTKEFLVTDPYAGKGSLISADASGTKLYQNDSVKLSTLGAGATVTGTMYATAFSGDGSQLTGVPISGNTGSFVRVDSQELVVSGLSTFQGNVYLGDGDVLYIGDGNDLQLYHNNVNSVIRDAGTGSLFLQSNDVRLMSVTNSNFARFTEGAEVELYYNGSQKFNTTGYGVTVLGTLDAQGLNISGVTTTTGAIHIDSDSADRTGSALKIGNSINGDISIYHTGTESVYWDNYGRTRFAGGKWEWTNLADSQQVVEFDQTYGVKLNYSGTRRFMTTNDGVHVAGIMTATSVSIGASNAEPNLTITSDGTDTFIKELNSTGELTISTNQLKIENPSFETLARFNQDADVKLYYDNAEKFATTSTGVNVSGIVTATSFSGEGGVTRWTLGANGSSDYTFTGIGFTETKNDPDLHLVRGQTYEFLNNSGGSHPFEIRTSAGGQAYNHGVTNNGASSGIIKFQVPYDAPTSLVYICTAHSSMVGNIYIDDNTVGPTVQNFTGIVTATSFQGNSTTGDGSDRGFTTKYYITADGSSNYRFAGPGVLNTTNDPTLYFHRGFTYILENSTGSGHPFELRVSAGGAAYNPGGSFLTGSINGTQVLTVPMDAPSSIVYQCTLHSGMLGTINFVS